MDISQRAHQARQASRRMPSQHARTRAESLKSVRQALGRGSGEIFDANLIDLERSANEGLAAPLMKRLKIDESKLTRALKGIEALERMPDPVGRILEKRELDTGLILSRVAVPIGVIGMIFESRPDALVQMATLALRSGNAIILKGGSEALETNRVLTRIIREASTGAHLADGGIPEGWIQLAENRAEVQKMLAMSQFIDLLVPRGSNEFVASIMKNSSIPVLGHADGVCHIYLDSGANPDIAVPIVLDSKMQYVAVCNAVETLLVHVKAAANLLPLINAGLSALGCELRGCERTRKIINIKAACEEDWEREYLDAILSIRVVDSLADAIDHIHLHGSGHTEAIITEDYNAAEEFLTKVDAADVFHNCSTRFSDGFVFGLGAEVGISTSKIHARGPVGVEGLLSYKWQLRGSGQIIADYSDGTKSFIHKKL